MRLKEEPAIHVHGAGSLDYSMIWILKTSLTDAPHLAVQTTDWEKILELFHIHGEYAPHAPKRLLLLFHKLDTSL